ncbi:MAG: AAA family ATPase [Chloroflexota bacterium]|nr:AAA family ATPase [Chloroflexota bacterium]
MDERTTDWAPDSLLSGGPDTWPLTARAAAAAIGVNERTIRRAIARGELPATKEAGVYRITPADLSRYRARGARSRPAGAGHAAASPRPLIGSIPEPPLWLVEPRPEAGPPRGVPAALTSLIGRQREVAEVTALLRQDDVRLLTLTGPGGVGKTRLALRVAETIAPPSSAEIAFVSLAAVSHPARVASAIARAVGAGEQRGHAIIDSLAAYLRPLPLLLILDNFEHVLDAAPIVSGLLASCPGLTILVTSRAPLQLSGERRYPVPPLALPGSRQLTDLEAMSRIEAIRLFVERARLVDPAFALTGANAAAVAAIGARLDGLPLAIELAAARVGIFPPAVLLDRLERRLLSLGRGPRDQPARLRSLHDAIAWSYDLLTGAERALFRRLAVFIGGFTLDAAQAVAADGAVLDGIEVLVSNSLLRRLPMPGDEGRFGMLETIRQFGLERLAEAGEEAPLRAAHAAYFAGFGERYHPNRVAPGERIDDRLDRLEADHPNFRAALAWLQGTGDSEGVLRLAGALATFWHLRVHFQEGRQWLEWALVHAAAAPDPLRGHGLSGLSMIAWSEGEYAETITLAEAGLAIGRQTGDAYLTALSLHMIGDAEHGLGGLARAEATLEKRSPSGEPSVPNRRKRRPSSCSARSPTGGGMPRAPPGGPRWGSPSFAPSATPRLWRRCSASWAAWLATRAISNARRRSTARGFTSA